MTTATATPATGTLVPQATARRVGPVIVATDGMSGSDAAVRASLLFASPGARDVIALTVLPPAPLVATEFGIVVPPEDTEEARRASLQQRVRDQVKECGGEDAGIRIEIRSGDPALVIARSALALEARIIAIGIGHHDLLDRLFGDETALQVLRTARVPLFIVPRTFSHLPTRVVIATDFSPASLNAARAALALLPGIEAITLAHVAPRVELQPDAYAAWISEYGTGVDAAFARFRGELAAPPRIAVDTVTLSGKPSRALLDFAQSTRAHAIVTGSRGHGLVDRILVGSTTTSLVRGAQCALLSVPGTGDDGRSFDTLPETAWAPGLAEFTRRNAGRQAMLEVDDPELGAHAQQRGYPFQGAAWDHHDRRIEIMLGELSSTRHLTRGIGDVRSVAILQNSAGRDLVLRVAHGDGQTVLTFLR